MSPLNGDSFPLSPTEALPTALHPEPRQHQHLGRSEERHGSEAKTFLHGHVQLGLPCCLCHIGSGYALSWVRLVTDAGCTQQCPRLWCLHGRQDCLEHGPGFSPQLCHSLQGWCWARNILLPCLRLGKWCSLELKGEWGQTLGLQGQRASAGCGR